MTLRDVDKDQVQRLELIVEAGACAMQAIGAAVLGDKRKAWRYQYRAARILGRAMDHAPHGKDTPEDYPNATHCPCAGVSPLGTIRRCAAGGCRYCKVSLELMRGA